MVTLRTACMIAVCAVLLPALPAAARGPGDGLYGRYDRPFTLAFGAGGGVAAEAGAASGVAVGELRLRHLDVAGPFVSLAFGPEAAGHAVAGVEIRPLFPLLFLENAFTGREVLDLFLQSLGVELGVAVTPFGSGMGAGLAWGVAAEVPLVPPSVWGQGVWLRLGLRQVRAPTAFQGGPERSASGWLGYATVSVKLGAGRSTTRPE
jgi:hypothetical protein